MVAAKSCIHTSPQGLELPIPDVDSYPSGLIVKRGTELLSCRMTEALYLSKYKRCIEGEANLPMFDGLHRCRTTSVQS